MESYRDWLTRTLSLSSSDASTNARLVIYMYTQMHVSVHGGLRPNSINGG